MVAFILRQVRQGQRGGRPGSHPPEAELCRATRQVMEKEGPQPAESEESSIYSPAIPREKWQRKRTQVKIRVCTPWPAAGFGAAAAGNLTLCQGSLGIKLGWPGKSQSPWW